MLRLRLLHRFELQMRNLMQVHKLPLLHKLLPLLHKHVLTKHLLINEPPRLQQQRQSQMLLLRRKLLQMPRKQLQMLQRLVLLQMLLVSQSQ